GKYNERRNECEQGLNILQKVLPGIKFLREVSVQDFLTHKELITDEVIRRRVEHVIYENERVIESVRALKNNDLILFGKLMNESHDSLKDLYEVTGQELDTLVEEARKVKGVLGSRMTGAGFGGCTVSLVHDANIDEFINQVGREYEKSIGYSASFYISEIGDGGQEVSLL
ncbi:MAG TPA: galactokinase, partial [Thermoclostridium sp.]|nr:galactokinase [Thermoclostridium sp.]